MKIINPSVEFWENKHDHAHVARCARVCYGRDSGNDEALVNHLLKNKHLSVFRHESVYAIIPTHDRELGNSYMYYINCPYIELRLYYGNLYVSTNRQFIIDNKEFPLIKIIERYIVPSNIFAATIPGFDMMRYTFCCITQISISRELNRVSPNAITEQSTRYVYENGTICRPHWMSEEIAKEVNKNLYPRNFEASDVENQKISEYIRTCANGFRSYRKLIDEYGMHRQDARGVLPVDTATKVVYTYSFKEWKHIIDLRYYETTGKAHPNAKIIAGMIKDKLYELGHKI